MFSLTTNGGNEYCGDVINIYIKQLNWGNDENDLKMIFIAGNEPFTQGNVNYKDATSNAKEKGVVLIQFSVVIIIRVSLKMARWSSIGVRGLHGN